MPESVNISSTTPNSVEAVVQNNTVTVTETGHTEIVVEQTSVNTIEILTPGPQGPKGDSGLSFNADTLTSTASFNAFTASYNTGSFSGSFSGDGNSLKNIPASAIVGLNLSQISSGSYSASISEFGLLVNNTIVAPSITSSLYGTSSWANNTISSSYSLTASYIDGGFY